MPKSRKKLLSQIIEQSKLNKFAQEAIEQTTEGDEAEGQQVAEQIFDKLLNEIDVESLN